MKFIIPLITAFFLISGICNAQTPTPIPPQALLSVQTSKTETTFRPRERMSRAILDVGNMEGFIICYLLAKDGKMGEPPIFRMNLMMRKKYPNASRSYIDEINTGVEKEIIKIYADDKFNFISIPFHLIEVMETSFDGIPTIINEKYFRFILSEHQLKRLTGSNEIKLEIGDEVYIIPLKNLKMTKEFIDKEMAYYYKYPM